MNYSTYDGVYQAYLRSGRYTFTFSSPGYAPRTITVDVSNGMTSSGYNICLEESNIPVPEFSTIATTTFLTLAVPLYVLGRKRK